MGPRGLGILGEGLYIIRELGSTCYYFKGEGEQAHSFVDVGLPCQKVNNKLKKSHLKGKVSIMFDFSNFFGL